ncbi:hypothetical protein BO71DRAFT_404292, partial [Aspergillus ellipticus CBS 707.79]
MNPESEIPTSPVDEQQFRGHPDTEAPFVTEKVDDDLTETETPGPGPAGTEEANRPSDESAEKSVGPNMELGKLGSEKAMEVAEDSSEPAAGGKFENGNQVVHTLPDEPKAGMSISGFSEAVSPENIQNEAETDITAYSTKPTPDLASEAANETIEDKPEELVVGVTEPTAPEEPLLEPQEQEGDKTVTGTEPTEAITNKESHELVEGAYMPALSEKASEFNQETELVKPEDAPINIEPVTEAIGNGSQEPAAEQPEDANADTLAQPSSKKKKKKDKKKKNGKSIDLGNQEPEPSLGKESSTPEQQTVEGAP